MQADVSGSQQERGVEAGSPLVPPLSLLVALAAVPAAARAGLLEAQRPGDSRDGDLLFQRCRPLSVVARLSDYYPPTDAGTALGLVGPLGPGPRERAQARSGPSNDVTSLAARRAPRHMPSCGAPRRRSRSEAFSGVSIAWEGRTQPPPEVCERLSRNGRCCDGRLLLSEPGADARQASRTTMLRDACSRSLFVPPWRRWLLLSCCFSPPSRSKFRSLPMAKPPSAPFVAAGVMIALLGPDLLGDLPKRIAPLLRFETQSRGTGDAARHHHRRDDHERSIAQASESEEGIGSVESIAHNPLPRMYFNTGLQPRPDLRLARSGAAGRAPRRGRSQTAPHAVRHPRCF